MTEQEGLGLIFALQKLHHYLLANLFHIYRKLLNCWWILILIFIYVLTILKHPSCVPWLGHFEGIIVFHCLVLSKSSILHLQISSDFWQKLSIATNYSKPKSWHNLLNRYPAALNLSFLSCFISNSFNLLPY